MADPSPPPVQMLVARAQQPNRRLFATAALSPNKCEGRTYTAVFGDLEIRGYVVVCEPLEQGFIIVNASIRGVFMSEQIRASFDASGRVQFSAALTINLGPCSITYTISATYSVEDKQQLQLMLDHVGVDRES